MASLTSKSCLCLCCQKLFLISVWAMIIFAKTLDQMSLGVIHQDNDNMVLSMCSAQCQSWCLESSESCHWPCFDENASHGALHWDIYFEQAEPSPEPVNLVGSCSAMKFNAKGYIPFRPKMRIGLVSRQQIILSWEPDPLAPPHTIYVIGKNMGDEDWAELGRVHGDTQYIDNITDFCNRPRYNVAAVSRYGSRWFTDALQPPEYIPGESRNIQLQNLELVDANTPAEGFDFALEWRPPEGWDAKDIKVQHLVNPSIFCFARMEFLQVILNDIQLSSQDGTVTTPDASFLLSGHLPVSAIGCQIRFEISAVSRCDGGSRGRVKVFEFLLNCSMVPDYKGEYCKAPELSVPGPVQDVKMTLVPRRLGVTGLVSWQPPADLGSAGWVKAYHLFYGLVCTKTPLSYFIDRPAQMVIPGYLVYADVVFNVTSLEAYQTIGVTVMAAGPMQNIETPMGRIYQASNPTEILHRKGDILAESDDFIVVGLHEAYNVSYFNSKSIGVEIYWNRPKPEARVNLTDYGFSWGLLKKESANHSLNGNLTFEVNSIEQRLAPKSKNSMVIKGLLKGKPYGIKMVFLYHNESLPVIQDPAWDNATVTVFNTPFSNESLPSHGSTNSSGPPIQITVDETGNVIRIVTIAVPTVSGVIVAALVSLVLYRKYRSRWKHGNQHLSEPPEYRPYSLYRPGLGFSSDDQEEKHMPVVVDEWELPLSCLKFGPDLGSGAFGKVVKGRVTRAMLTHRGVMPVLADNGSSVDDHDKLHVTVAIKLLPDDSEERHKRDFLKEIQQMKRIGHHRHVVSILGCCTLRAPVCLVVEHMANGDLLNYLKTVRRHLTYSKDGCERNYVNQNYEPSTTDLLKFAWEITKGMDFLASKDFVHRDLAARNVLVDSKGVCKIGDFGLTRYMYDNAVYVNRHGGRLPIKWMSVEAIFDMSFSTASDVWSFGIVLFELVTLGGTPYPTIPSRQLLKKLKMGYRMERPDSCSEKIYQMMLSCWSEQPTARPTFHELSQQLEAMMADLSASDYHKLEVDPTKDMYQANEDSDNDDICTLPECVTEVPDPARTLGRTLPLPEDDQDFFLHATTSSEDSGYMSPQKCSVSSGESNSLLMPSYMGGQLEKGVSCTQGDAQFPINHRLAVHEPGLHRKGDLGDVLEGNLDDVFHDEVCTNDNAFPHFTAAASLRKEISPQDSIYQNLDIGGGTNDKGVRHHERYSFSLDESETFTARRSFSDSLIEHGHKNGHHAEESISFSRRTLTERFSEPEIGLRRRRSSTKLLNNDAISLPPNVIFSSAKKTKTLKNTPHKTRRNAVVTPPTLAMDNDLYFKVDQDKRQQPPPTRVQRRICSNNSLIEFATGKSLTRRLCASKSDTSVKRESRVNVPNDDSQKGKVRRKSSVFQYIVFADVHNAFNQDDNEMEKQTSPEITGTNTFDIQNKSTSPSVRVKKTFVKPTTDNPIKYERKGSLLDQLPYKRPYADFNNIFRHTFSSPRWTSSSSRSAIYNSDLCLTQQGTKEHYLGNISPLINARHRCFSEDSALDLYGLDRCSCSDSPPYFTTSSRFSYWNAQSLKDHTDSSTDSTQASEAEASPTRLDGLWPTFNPKRRLSDPFSTTKVGLASLGFKPQTSHCNQCNHQLVCSHFWKAQFSRFLSVRKRNHGIATNVTIIRSQTVAPEKHPSALHGVRKDAQADIYQKSLKI